MPLPLRTTTLFKICIAVLSRYILGLGVGYLILPAQTMFTNRLPPIRPRKENYGQLELSYFGVNTSDGVMLDTVEISSNPKDLNCPYVIKFCGNGMTYHQIISELVSTAERNNATVIGFDYPNVGSSTSVRIYSQTQLVNSGIAQVQRLLDKGINPKNITLHGLSLGGGVATLVAAHFHQQNPPKKVYLINDRSFSSIANAVSGFRRSSNMENIVRFALYLLGWNMNAADAYRKIPDTHKMIIVSKDDSVIHYRLASLYQAVKPDLKRKYADDMHAYKAITHAYKISNGHTLNFVHGEPLDSLLDKDGQPTVLTINKFVTNKSGL